MLKNECTRNCWLAAAIAGLLVWLVNWTFFGGLVMGLLTFFLLGSLLVWGLCQGRGGVAEDREVLGQRRPVAQPVDDGVLGRAENAVVEAGSAIAIHAVSTLEKGREKLQEYRESKRHNARAYDGDSGTTGPGEGREPGRTTPAPEPTAALSHVDDEIVTSATAPGESREPGQTTPAPKPTAASSHVDDEIVTPATAPEEASVLRTDETVSPAGLSAMPLASDVEPGGGKTKRGKVKADKSKPAKSGKGKSKSAKDKSDKPIASGKKAKAGKSKALTAGVRDDLKQIKGVGPKLEAMLHENGVTRFEHIAAWSDEDIDRYILLVGRMGGRIRSDDWVGQARTLAQGGATEFSGRVSKGEVY